MMKQLNMEPLEDEYFNDAIAYYRDSYDNCIFIVGSDDIEWSKKHIDASKGDIFFSESRPTFSMDDDGNLIEFLYVKDLKKLCQKKLKLEPMYKTDDMIRDAGHIPLRLPVYHCKYCKI